MGRSRIQNVVSASIVLIPALLSTWPTVISTPSDGHIKDFVRLNSVDDIPVLEAPASNLNVLIVTRHMYNPETSTVQGEQPEGVKSNPSLQLTKKGGELMELVGKLLMKRYEPHFRNMINLQQSQNDLVQVTATDSDIARKSAWKVIEGLKNQSPELTKTWDISLLEKNIEKNAFFNPRLLRKPEQGKCKMFDNLANKLNNPKHIPCVISTMQTYFTIPLNNVEDVFQQYDRLQMQRFDGLELPEWTKKEHGNEVLRKMKRLAIKRMQNLIGDNIHYWRFFVSPMIYSICFEFKIPRPGYLIKKDDQIMSQRKPRLHLHLADEYLMTALVWWLRLEEEIPAKFGPPDDAKYYPLVGDSLIIEINDDSEERELLLKAYYLKPLGESGSQVGFKELSFEKKIETDASLLEIPNRGLHHIWLYSYMYTDEESWETCCKGKDTCDKVTVSKPF